MGLGLLLLLLLLLLLSLAQANQRGVITPVRTCPTLARDDLLACLTVVDTNEDGTLTAAEIDAYIAAHLECLPASTTSNVNGSFIITQCDTDASGSLTMLDWNAGGGVACFDLRSHQMTLCDFCTKCGAYPPPPP